MNREQIIRMAREAGMQPYYDAQSPAIERFAALVAAAEREVCAKIAESWATEETEITCENISRAIRRHPCKGARMTDAEIDNLWLEAFKASSDDGKVRQRFAELCYQKGAAEMKVRRDLSKDWDEDTRPA
jgi:hypothetical protein